MATTMVPKKEGVADKVRAVLSAEWGLDEDQFTPDATFVGDLGADSLDMVEAAMALEQTFGVALDDAAVDRVWYGGDPDAPEARQGAGTVRGLVELVERRVAAARRRTS